jgi:hypothetical protein
MPKEKQKPSPDSVLKKIKPPRPEGSEITPDSVLNMPHPPRPLSWSERRKSK